MPNEEVLSVREILRKNLEDIDRRQKANDPLEVRKIPDTDLIFRVWGFVNGYPVIANEDWIAFNFYIEERYKCNWCLDSKRVRLHGEQHTLSNNSQKLESVCPRCCPIFTAKNYAVECERMPGIKDAGVDVRSLIVGALTAYLNRVFYPHITKAQYIRLLGPVGSLVSLDGRALTVKFQPYVNADDTEAGRLILVDDQGNDYFPCEKNKRPSDKT